MITESHCRLHLNRKAVMTLNHHTPSASLLSHHAPDVILRNMCIHVSRSRSRLWTHGQQAFFGGVACKTIRCTNGSDRKYKDRFQNKSPTLAGSTCTRATAELAAAGHGDKAQGSNVDRSLPHGEKVSAKANVQYATRQSWQRGRPDK